MELQELTTARLSMRSFEMEDVLALYEKIAADGDVVRYLPEDPHQELGETLAWLEETVEGPFHRWAVTLEDELIGTAELIELEPKRWTVGVKLASDQWGQGYGTETLKELTRYAFEALDAQRVQAEPFANHQAAQTMLEKAGFHRAGTLSERFEKHGIPMDAVYYEIRKAVPAITANEYQTEAMGFMNAAFSKSDALLNGVMGLCGESGECIDLVKKHLHQGHDLDREAMKKELGDVAWYLAETAWALDISLEEVLRGNLEKLKRRYPGGFSAEKSRNRK